MESLSRRAIRGGILMAAKSVTGHLLGTVRVLVLARLLTPHDFGMVTIGLTLIALYGGLSNPGAQLALIRRQNRAHELFDTAWTLGLIRGGLGSAIQLAVAPALAAFFSTPDALGIIRVLALLPILDALVNVAMVEARRDFAFGHQYVIQSAAMLADIAVAIPLAIWLRSAWALVGGMLAAGVARVLLSYWLHPYRPALRLNRVAVRELTELGPWLLVTRVLKKLLSIGVPAVVGRMFGVEAVGLFGMASRVADLPRNQVTKVVGPVSIVAYARLQDSPDRLRGAYVRTVRLVALVAAPLAAGVVLYGGDLIEVLLGSQWQRAAPMLQAMGVCGLVRALGDTTDPLFAGTGRPWVRARVQTVELLLVAACLGLLATRGGTVGVAWAVAIGAIGAETVGFLSAARLLHLSAWKLLAAFAWPLGACLTVAALRLALPVGVDAPALLGGALVVSAGLYVTIMLVLDRLKLYRVDVVFHPSNWRRGAEQLWKETGARWLPPNP